MSVTTQVQVQGMTCQHCVTAVTEEVSAIGGVSAVDVDLSSGEVLITSDLPLEHDLIESAITEAGYTLAVT